MIPSAFAASSEATKAADALNALGLFNGTGTDANGKPVYDLDRAPTRAEAVTMLVRLLGKAGEATAGTWTTPFTDVADWAKPYVGYAYANKLTSGTSATTFGGSSVMTATQYITLVLCALGYKSGTDFQWDKAWELSDKIGLTDGQYNASATKFTRGDVAQISKTALTVCEKDSDTTLAGRLLDNGAIEMGAALLAGVAPGTEVVSFDTTVDENGRCRVCFSDLKVLFPNAKEMSITGGRNDYESVDDYLIRSNQMAALISFDGTSGANYTGRASMGNVNNGIILEVFLYSDATTVCAFSVGVPERVDGTTYRLHFTRCSYDFRALYEQQAETFAQINWKYIPPEDAISSGAVSFLRGDNVRNDQSKITKTQQLYKLWYNLVPPVRTWAIMDIKDFQKSATWNTADVWSYYCLLLGANKQPIGYTIMDSTMS